MTHDRWFLDEVCTSPCGRCTTASVDPFEGGYSAYILQRVERDRHGRGNRGAPAATSRARSSRGSRRGAQARSTKPKFRVEAARALIADVPPMRNELELKRLAVSRLGKQVVDLKDVSELLGDNLVLDHLTWSIGPGDRYGIVGENGAGKSTLLRVIDGSLPPTAGTVKIGATVRFAVLSQRLDELMAHAGETVLEVLGQCKSRYVIDGKEVTPSQLLERLGFDPRQKLTRVEELSGGQRRRLQLMLVLLSEPNVLILDEPGNDMDTDMLAVMEDLLDGWPGTLILVSHDRYLMERVTDHQFALIDGKVRHLPGGVDEFLRLVEERDAQRGQAVSAGMPGSVRGGAGEADGGDVADVGQGGLTRQEEYQLKKQLASVERKLDSTRAKLEQARAMLLEIEPTDFVALGKQQERVDEIQAQVDALEEEWLELSERLGA